MKTMKSLGHWGKMAMMHWKEYLPKKYRKLEEEGTLWEKLAEAEEKAMEMMGDLTENGLHRPEVLEIVLPRYILLRPESSEDDEPLPPEWKE